MQALIMDPEGTRMIGQRLGAGAGELERIARNMETRVASATGPGKSWQGLGATAFQQGVQGWVQTLTGFASDWREAGVTFLRVATDWETALSRIQASLPLTRVGMVNPYNLTALAQEVAIRQRAVVAERAAMAIHAGPILYQLDQEAQALASIQAAITLAEQADALGAAALDALAAGRTVVWNQAMHVLGQCTAVSPQGSAKAFFDQMAGMIGQTLGWIVNPLNPLMPGGPGEGGMNPAAGLKIVRDLGLTGLGVLGMLGGGVGEVGGFALDATGVGAVAGVPVNVASAALAAAGATTATAGAALLGKDLGLLMAQSGDAAGSNSTTGSTVPSDSTGSPDIGHDVSNLQNTQNFRPGALDHILEGQVNSRGAAVGFHYEGLPNSPGKIVPDTESPPNQYGVYQANVEVNGILKRTSSTFFPKSWSPQQVVDAINEAYQSRVFQTGNKWEGVTSTGMTIQMYLFRSGQIISAFPIHIE